MLELEKSLVLFSGGLDSTTALALAISDNPEGQIHTLSVYYGSKHNAREIKAANNVVAWYADLGVNIRHNTINLIQIFKGAESALMPESDVEMPHLTYQQILEGEGPSPTVVPYRNGIMLSIATARAIILGCSRVYAGMHATDANNSAYPDCTWPFLKAQGEAIRIGSYGAIELVTPFIDSAESMMTKEEVCAQGIGHNAPLHLTWSCYEGREKHCGICPTCIERIEAFKASLVIDPVEYEIPVDWGNIYHRYEPDTPVRHWNV